jgi:asparagine synthase (glutamine-hydrolysing)
MSGPLAKVFRESVARHMISDVPVGSCLSGGIDSSGIVCEMRTLNPDGLIQTFSLEVPGTSFDERKYQQEVATAAKTLHHSTSIDPEKLLEDLPDLIRTQEEPFENLSVYGQYLVMKIAHESGLKVLLDGQGADELLAGYHTFYGYNAFGKRWLFARLPWFVRKKIKRPAWFQGEPRKMKYPRNLREALDLAFRSYSLPALLRFEDKNSMRWSIEARVPYLDREFVDACNSLDEKSKLDGTVTKKALRDSFRGLVPDVVLERRDKIGFWAPDRQLLERPEVRQFVAGIIESESFKSRPYWDATKVKLDDPDVWKLVLAELWLREFRL